MASDEDFKAVVKIVLRHKIMLDVVFGVCNDFARLIEPTLERCSHTHCKSPATVLHVDMQVKMCDYHAAHGILTAKKNLLKDPTDALTLLRTRLADEECWVDVPNAEQIRRLELYVNELSKNDAPEPPADKAEFH